MAENEINKVNLLIRRFVFEVDGILGDKDACQKWLTSFAKTLQFQDLYKGEPNEYALFLLREASAFNALQRRKIAIRYARKNLKAEGIENPTKEQIDAMIEKMSSGNDNDDVALDTPVPDKASDLSTAGTPIASVPAVQNGPKTLNFAYSGEFGNVSLTQDQYNELLQQVGNIKTCNGMIDDFSASIADGSTTSANHFATLKKWAKARKRFDEEKAEPNANVLTFQEREGKRQADQLRKYGLIK